MSNAQEGGVGPATSTLPAQTAGDAITPAQPQQQQTAQHQYQGKEQPPQQPYDASMPQLQAPGYAVPLQCLADLPAIVDCPFCHHRVLTHTMENDSSMTLLAGLALGFACLCLACLPCLGGWFQDVDHYCPVCKQRVAFVPYNKPAQIFFPSAGPMPQQYVMGPYPQYGPPPADGNAAHPQPQPQAAQAGQAPTTPAPPQYERYA
ncbi:LPS-induced tumor necrosis factor alpha factor [Apiospora kogelbergensis]|uniref:LPS-induced tumor necrosis factor alpha factor n=1 Tax=Apiospora kogelbergensis TaxID=1337665 RepID=UPI00312D21CB